jgi:hypothetical protein
LGEELAQAPQPRLHSSLRLHLATERVLDTEKAWQDIRIQYNDWIYGFSMAPHANGTWIAESLQAYRGLRKVGTLLFFRRAPQSPTGNAASFYKRTQIGFFLRHAGTRPGMTTK